MKQESIKMYALFQGIRKLHPSVKKESVSTQPPKVYIRSHPQSTFHTDILTEEALKLNTWRDNSSGKVFKILQKEYKIQEKMSEEDKK